MHSNMFDVLFRMPHTYLSNLALTRHKTGTDFVVRCNTHIRPIRHHNHTTAPGASSRMFHSMYTEACLLSRAQTRNHCSSCDRESPHFPSHIHILRNAVLVCLYTLSLYPKSSPHTFLPLVLDHQFQLHTLCIGALRLRRYTNSMCQSFHVSNVVRTPHNEPVLRRFSLRPRHCHPWPGCQLSFVRVSTPSRAVRCQRDYSLE